MKERRRGRRVKRRLTVRYGEEDLTRAGFTYDVSTGGAFIMTDGRPTKSGRLHLQLFLNKDHFVLLEGVIVRERQVPPELRQVAKGGFGVRFLSTKELLVTLLPETTPAGDNHFVIEYPTAEDLRRATAMELRHGGVFVPTMAVLPRDSEVTVELRLGHVGRTFTFPAKVLQVADGGGGGVRGLGLVFIDPTAAAAALAPFSEAAAT